LAYTGRQQLPAWALDKGFLNIDGAIHETANRTTNRNDNIDALRDKNNNYGILLR